VRRERRIVRAAAAGPGRQRLGPDGRPALRYWFAFFVRECVRCPGRVFGFFVFGMVYILNSIRLFKFVGLFSFKVGG